MPEGDAFEAAYGRLAWTPLASVRPVSAEPAAGHRDVSSPVRWAASSLLPRLQALAPKRRTRRPRPAIDD